MNNKLLQLKKHSKTPSPEGQLKINHQKWESQGDSTYNMYFAKPRMDMKRVFSRINKRTLGPNQISCLSNNQKNASPNQSTSPIPELSFCNKEFITQLQQKKKTNSFKKQKRNPSPTIALNVSVSKQDKNEKLEKLKSNTPAPFLKYIKLKPLKLQEGDTGRTFQQYFDVNTRKETKINENKFNKKRQELINNYKYKAYLENEEQFNDLEFLQFKKNDIQNIRIQNKINPIYEEQKDLNRFENQIDNFVKQIQKIEKVTNIDTLFT